MVEYGDATLPCIRTFGTFLHGQEVVYRMQEVVHGMNDDQLKTRRAQMIPFWNKRMHTRLTRLPSARTIAFYAIGGVLFLLALVLIPAVFKIWARDGPSSGVILITAMTVGIWSAVSFGIFKIKRDVALARLWRISFRKAWGGASMGMDVLSWLNQYWPAEYHRDWFHGSTRLESHAFSARGFPGLIIGDPLAPTIYGFNSYRLSEPRVHLFIAAWIPGLSDGGNRPADASPEADKSLNVLKTRGYDVAVNPAGLFATETGQVTLNLEKHPGRIAEVVPIADLMAQLAQQLGGTPAEALHK